MRLTRLAIATAPVLFVLLWSTGFIGARYGLPYIEPLTFLAVRMAFVVLIMAAIAFIGRARVPNAREVRHALVAGALVHGLYLGGVFTAISQGVPAGVSALIPGLQPILTSTIANRFMGETVTRTQWLGLALGLVGVMLVLHDRSIVIAGSAVGWIASFLSLIGITGMLLMAGIVAEASQHGLTPMQILAAIPLLVPSTLPYTIPATTLFATCVVYGRLAADNEILAIKAAGINILSVVGPSVLLGLAMTALTVVLYYDLIPRTHHIMRSMVLQDIEEYLYGVLKREHCINYSRLNYMMHVRSVQGRTLTGDDLRELRALIAQHPDWHRTALSLHLCEQWDWRNGAGRLKDMAARTLLLKLEQRGYIRLPAKRRASPNRMRHKRVRPIDHATESICTA
jgi:drug/metabolite transporter (DMT)-like permease